MRHLHVLLILAAMALASVPAAAQRPGFDRERIRDRESGLNEVLQDIQVNHPEIWRRLESVLGDNPQRGRWRMARQARYLRERADAERQDPVTFALLLQQETMEAQVRKLVGRHRLADQDGSKRDVIVQEIRGVLDNWFDVRQSLRLRHLERFEADYETQIEQLEAAEADPDAAAEGWAERITRGGPEAMMERLAQFDRADDLEPLAPALLRAMARRDPSARRALARLAKEDPAALRGHLERIAAEHPDIVAEVRGQWAETVTLHANLLAAQRDATEAALAGATRRLEHALQVVVQADLEIARHNLDRVRRGLERKQRWFEERRANQPTIIELQLSRLLDESERFEW